MGNLAKRRFEPNRCHRTRPGHTDRATGIKYRSPYGGHPQSYADASPFGQPAGAVRGLVMGPGINSSPINRLSVRPFPSPELRSVWGLADRHITMRRANVCWVVRSRFVQGY